MWLCQAGKVGRGNKGSVYCSLWLLAGSLFVLSYLKSHCSLDSLKGCARANNQPFTAFVFAFTAAALVHSRYSFTLQSPVLISILRSSLLFSSFSPSSFHLPFIYPSTHLPIYSSPSLTLFSTPYLLHSNATHLLLFFLPSSSSLLFSHTTTGWAVGTQPRLGRLGRGWSTNRTALT